LHQWFIDCFRSAVYEFVSAPLNLLQVRGDEIVALLIKVGPESDSKEHDVQLIHARAHLPVPPQEIVVYTTWTRCECRVIESFDESFKQHPEEEHERGALRWGILLGIHPVIGNKRPFPFTLHHSKQQVR